MTLLKDDGSLDIEKINNLPLNEFMYEMGRLTQKQVAEYFSKQPSCDSKDAISPIVVDYDFDDERSGMEIGEFLTKMRNKIGRV